MSCYLGLVPVTPEVDLLEEQVCCDNDLIADRGAKDGAIVPDAEAQSALAVET
jgi:hypothetical protein